MAVVEELVARILADQCPHLVQQGPPALVLVPQQPAVEFEDEVWTYEQLQRYADAHRYYVDARAVETREQTLADLDATSYALSMCWRAWSVTIIWTPE